MKPSDHGSSSAILITAVLAILILLLLAIKHNLILTTFGITLYDLGLSKCCPPNTVGKLTIARINMHSIQLGIEKYADHHNGKYPYSLLDPDFTWSTYVVAGLDPNPYDKDMKGIQLIDENIKVDLKSGRSLSDIARADKRTFHAPGMIRYYVDRVGRTTYAITGSRKDGLPMPVDPFLGPKSPILVLHNPD